MPPQPQSRLAVFGPPIRFITKNAVILSRFGREFGQSEAKDPRLLLLSLVASDVTNPRDATVVTDPRTGPFPRAVPFVGYPSSSACAILDSASMMWRSVFGFLTGTALACASALSAQTPAEPTAYTVTVRISITGPVTRTTYRLGSKVLIDQRTSDSRVKILYDLATLESLSWDPANPSSPCVSRGFHPPEWQDPFSGAADLTMQTVEHVGTETLRGIPAEILEFKDHRDPAFRLWVDPQTGLMLKATFVSKKLNTTLLWLEVMDVSLKPPPASLFAAPASCSAAAKPASGP